MIIIYFLIIITIVLCLFSLWLFYQSQLVRKSAEINCILFERTEAKIELELTVVQRLGDKVRYLLYLMHLLSKTIRYKVKKVYGKIKGLLGLSSTTRNLRRSYFDRGLWRNKQFFPSFDNWLYKLKRDEREWSPTLAGSGYAAPSEAVHLIGTVNLPKKIYVNDSCVIELSLVPEMRYLSNESPALSLIKTEDGRVFVKAIWNNYSKSFEIKLIGVGVDVTPIEPEIQSGHSAFFSWGCAFPHSGLQTLVFRVSLHGENVSANSRLNHVVKVVQLDHLTSRQIRVFAGIAAILGVVSTGLGILKVFGLLLPVE